MWWKRRSAKPADEPRRTVYRNREEHTISRRDIDPDALSVLYRLSHCGHTAYLVGGGVRDLLLGRKPKDFDISTDAHPGRIRKLFRNCFLIGRRFRLAHIRFGDKVIETSTFRRAPTPEESHAKMQDGALHHRDNTFGTPEQDARRRDFTVNGMFYDIRTFHVIDHVGGLEDLDRRLIRSIGDPDVRFMEDPVRMLRAIRFAARLGFTIEEATWRALVRRHAEIQKAAPPRLLEEIIRLAAYRSAGKAFRMLREAGLLTDLFPEIEAHLRGEREPEAYWRYLDELDRRDGAGDAPPPQALLFAVLAYPVFLARVRALEAAGERPSRLAVAHEILDPWTPRFSMPRNSYYQAVHLLDAQRKFTDSVRQGGARRFAEREDFALALELRRIYLAANGRPVEPLQEWAELVSRPPAEGEQPRREGGREEPEARRRRPRRRRRGGRSRPEQGAAGEQAPA
jgi:poly(A) polymerase